LPLADIADDFTLLPFRHTLSDAFSPFQATPCHYYFLLDFRYATFSPPLPPFYHIFILFFRFLRLPPLLLLRLMPPQLSPLFAISIFSFTRFSIFDADAFTPSPRRRVRAYMAQRWRFICARALSADALPPMRRCCCAFSRAFAAREARYAASDYSSRHFRRHISRCDAIDINIIAAIFIFILLIFIISLFADAAFSAIFRFATLMPASALRCRCLSFRRHYFHYADAFACQLC